MQDGVAVIRVNNIEVGSMPLEQYEDIVRSVNESWLMRIDSFNSYIWYLFKIFCGLVELFIKTFLFLTVVAIIIFYYSNHPGPIPDGDIPLRIVDIYKITQFILNASIVMTILTLVLKLVFSGGEVRSSFVSPRKHAIAYKIRQVMEVPTEGSVSVTVHKTVKE
ncbi:hypothetical protein G3151_004817 [Salmonella enterica subsp. enterica serovar Montevideo]|nr:hypothetical protein [Salmonella enterica subsp. enterica serovar Montevideo]